jgi:GNAT superfamily N-acetyltransferase
MISPVSVRDAHVSDIPVIEAVIRVICRFTPEEADGFASSLPGHSEGEARGRLWLIAGDGMWAGHLSPEAGPGVWNLRFLGVRPEARRQGVARALMAEVE